MTFKLIKKTIDIRDKSVVFGIAEMNSDMLIATGAFLVEGWEGSDT